METSKLDFTLYGRSASGDIDMPITALQWRPASAQLKTPNVIVTAQADGALRHWNGSTGKLLYSMLQEPENHLYALDFNSEGTLLATGGKDHFVRVYDETTKALAMKMKGRGEVIGHSNRIYCVKFNERDYNMLASGGWDNTVKIYDLRV